MDIQTRKIQFVTEFLKLKSEETISRFEKLLRYEKDTVQSISIEELNERIDTSLLDSKNDKATEASKLLNEIREWG